MPLIMIVNHHIKSIKIKRLFGRYSYSLPSSENELSNLNILYGENGIGKTTLLNLVFQLLSIAQGKNYLDFISRTAFETLVVTLNDSTTISAKKDAQLLIGSVMFSVKAKGGIAHEWEYIPGQQGILSPNDIPEGIDLSKVSSRIRKEVEQTIRQRSLFDLMNTLEAKVYMLTSDRILLGVSGEATAAAAANRLPQDRTRVKVSDLVVSYRNEAISDALQSTSRWLQEQFLDSSYGSTGAASNVYEDVILRISNTQYKTRAGLGKGASEKIKETLLKDIKYINENSVEYRKIGLRRTDVSRTVYDIVQNCTGNKLFLIDNVLSPYLAELKERQRQIHPTNQIIKQFINAANRFFHDKKLVFKIITGLKIFVAHDGEITDDEIKPEQLSSGEKQLIFILCRVLTARGKTSIFIIDEPEISLNVVWQRMLMATLLELSSPSELQLIIASHSMEIIAQHNDRVLILEDNAQ